MRIGVDIDGIVFEEYGLLYYNPEKVGALLPGARLLLRLLKKRGHTLVVYSGRMNPEYVGNMPHTLTKLYEILKGHLDKHKIPYDEISMFKPICAIYIDDRSVNTIRKAVRRAKSEYKR